jgi:hypothetical protein
MIAPTFLALALGSQLFMTVADRVPEFDVAPGCSAASALMRANVEACVKEEQSAHAQLASEWERFAASDRATCTQNEMVGGTPSYVELLACLQFARDARKEPADTTTGSDR